VIPLSDSGAYLDPGRLVSMRRRLDMDRVTTARWRHARDNS